MQALRHDDEGAIAIIVALFSVVLFGFAALVVDVGNASDVRAQASTAADAGALAGERALADWTNKNPGASPDPTFEQTLFDEVKQAVAATYSVDDSDWSSCADAVPADFTSVAASQCVQFKMTMSPPPDDIVTASAVRVRVPVRKVPSTFGGIFGTSSISVSPVAAAKAGQDPPSPCLACDPRLDDTTGEPVSGATLPTYVRNALPDPSTVALAPPVDAFGCPTGPGRFDTDVDVVMPDNVTPCALPAGLYVFNDAALHVTGALQGGGVTLVFYGTNSQPLDVEGPLKLVAPPPSPLPPTIGDPIPGVAIVIDQYASLIQQPRAFELGAAFTVTGSVYALDGDTTWKTDDGDCVMPNVCAIHDDGEDERIAVTATDFGDGGSIPSVAVDPGHPLLLPPPQSEHLSE